MKPLPCLLLSMLVVLVPVGCGARVHTGAATTTTPPVPTTTPTVPGGWMPLSSDTPQAALAAFKQSGMLDTSNCPPNLDCEYDLSHLGTPQLVWELRLPGKPQEPDYYVLPILNADGSMVITLAVAPLNPAHTALRVPYLHDTPQPTWPALVSAEQALAIVQAQHHAGLQATAQVRLVYLPLDSVGLQRGTITWHAGGTSAEDPVWSVPGTDGQDHLVGTDGRAYYPQEFPLVAS